MTDVRRVSAVNYLQYKRTITWDEAKNGTHALLPWSEYERLRKVVEAATSLIEYGYGGDFMKLKNALRELEGCND